MCVPSPEVGGAAHLDRCPCSPPTLAIQGAVTLGRGGGQGRAGRVCGVTPFIHDGARLPLTATVLCMQIAGSCVVCGGGNWQWCHWLILLLTRRRGGSCRCLDWWRDRKATGGTHPCMVCLGGAVAVQGTGAPHAVQPDLPCCVQLPKGRDARLHPPAGLQWALPVTCDRCNGGHQGGVAGHPGCSSAQQVWVWGW